MRLPPCIALLALVAGCGRSPAAPDASRDTGPDVQGVPVDGAGLEDRGPPYDAGPPPACAVSAFTWHVLDASGGVDTLEPAGLARVPGGYLVVARQGASRVAPPDGSLVRRDTVDVAAVSELGFLRAGWSTVYDSTAAATDLSLPAVAALADGAMVLFRESRGAQGAEEFTSRLRGASLGASGAARGVDVYLPDRGDAFAAPLPDGTVLALSPRLFTVGDAAVAVATPNALHLRADGTVVSAMGVDLTNVIPISAESVLMRPSPTGAVVVFRVLTDVQVVHFDARGVVDTRVRISRGVDATRLDDAAVVAGGVVVGWDEPSGDAHAIHAAVLDPDGRIVANTVLERFDGASQPTVAVTATYGGAAVTWLRGAGKTTALRGVVLQPDGAPRGAPRDLLPVPDADGRLIVVGEGRALAFVARDRVGATHGITVGGLCLPE